MSLTSLRELPPSLAKLPRAHGFPVPWFVCYFNGKPDFRVIDPVKRLRAMKQGLCWICGERLRPSKTFVLGPMCVIQRISYEPPSHPDCAEAAMRICPFLSMTEFARREAQLPDPSKIETIPLMQSHNPGVHALWTTTAFRRDDTLVHVGAPSSVTWRSHGRPATRAEVCDALKDAHARLEDKGHLPVLWLDELHREAIALAPPDPS